MQLFRFSYTTDANPALGGSWTQLTPTSATTTAATIATINANNTISVTGTNVVPDNYQIVTNGASGITGFRLEAFVGANGTIGFSGSNGNIVLSELQVSAVIPEPSTYLVFGGLALCFGAAGWWRKRRQNRG